MFTFIEESAVSNHKEFKGVIKNVLTFITNKLHHVQVLKKKPTMYIKYPQYHAANKLRWTWLKTKWSFDYAWCRWNGFGAPGFGICLAAFSVSESLSSESLSPKAFDLWYMQHPVIKDKDCPQEIIFSKHTFWTFAVQIFIINCILSPRNSSSLDRKSVV